MKLTEQAPAKINLYLHVTGKRADGYHLLDSLAVFAGVGDGLTAAPADDLQLTIDGPFGAGLTAAPDNLVLRAARALAAQAGHPPAAKLVLTKNLPIASGIGGGSADAAATLRVLTRLWGLAPASASLAKLALELGADVPVCLASQPAQMAGIGEILSPVPRLPAIGMVLVNPGVAVTTPAVFKTRQGGFSDAPVLPPGFADTAALVAFLRETQNDLETAAIALAPVIGDVLAALAACPGVQLARMSGSGATCFAICGDAAAALVVAEHYQRHFPDHWVWGGGLWAI
jgi:4-diphosphocytidyl-2-C-methyl-D-erythritol kinase